MAAGYDLMSLYKTLFSKGITFLLMKYRYVCTQEAGEFVVAINSKRREFACRY